MVDLLGPNSWILFMLLKTGTSWLQSEPESEDPGYQETAAFVTTVKVTNDVAKCGFKLITGYAEILTKDEVPAAGSGAPPAPVPGLPKEDRSIWALDYSVLDHKHLRSACLLTFCFLRRIENSIDQNGSCPGNITFDTYLKWHIVIDMAPT